MGDAALDGLDDTALMARAVDRAEHSRLLASPNPWVGAVVVVAGGTTFEGSTRRPGGEHAERVALARAGSRARGATLYSTLEPCSHQGRTAPCVEAIIDAGIARVVIGLVDPDPQVAGRGVAALESAGIPYSYAGDARTPQFLVAAVAQGNEVGRSV